MKSTGMYLGQVFLASCCILSYEILLTRIFAVSQWNHLFFLVISIALVFAGAMGNIVDSVFYGVLFSASSVHGPAAQFLPGERLEIGELFS